MSRLFAICHIHIRFRDLTIFIAIRLMQLLLTSSIIFGLFTQM